MERGDLGNACRLMEKVLGDHYPCDVNMKEIFEWMYFSGAIKDNIPRAFVIADGHSVAGHVGLTLSEFTDGTQSLRVIQTANWVVDPNFKVGLLSLRLILEAISLGEVAIIIGGTEFTRRIIPRLGFIKQMDVERYIKVLKPASYLSVPRSGKGLLRHGWKLMMFLANSPSSFLKFSGRDQHADHHLAESSSYDSAGSPASAVAPARPRRVLRNTMNADFLNWYKQFPQGDVHVLKLNGEGMLPNGWATVLLQSRKGTRFANLLNVDADTDDPSVWSETLLATEKFLRNKGVTHINTLATYEPLRQALKMNGYVRLNCLPLWVRDRDNRLADVEAWHITAIEGDMGYLLV
jgi:hypothetical protein